MLTSDWWIKGGADGGGSELCSWSGSVSGESWRWSSSMSWSTGDGWSVAETFWAAISSAVRKRPPGPRGRLIA